MPKTKPFTIVHLSDLHLTASDFGHRSEPKLLGELMGMNDAFRQVIASPAVQACDLLLVTGDVTDDGTKKAWRVFWRTIRAHGLHDRCRVLPGNHDVCCLGSRILTPARDRYKRDVKRMREGLALGGEHVRVRFPWSELVGDDVLLVGLDSCNKGNPTALSNAIGHLGNGQLEALARTLKKHRRVPIKIVALHHSPNIPQPETARRRGVEEMSDAERWGMEVPDEDRRSLRWICLAADVRLVVHGHVHRREDRRVNGVRFVGAPATTEPIDRGNGRRYGFWRYVVKPDRSRVRAEFVVV